MLSRHDGCLQSCPKNVARQQDTKLNTSASDQVRFLKLVPEELEGRPKRSHCILYPLSLSDPGCCCRRMPAASAMVKCVRGAPEQRQSLCGAALAVATTCMLAALTFGPNTRSYTPSVCENATATMMLHASNLSGNIQTCSGLLTCSNLVIT